MSLLLDALKRAEQEKHTRNGERPPAARSALPSPPAAANSPTAGLELQPLGSQAAQQQPPPRSEASAHAAQVVFAAKAPREENAGRGVLWATVGIIVIVVAAAAAYVWYSLRMLTPQLVAAAAVRPAPAPTPPPAAGMTIGELPAAGSAPPRGATSPTPAPPATLEAASPDPRKEPPTPRTSESLVSQILREGTAVPAAAAVPAPPRFAPTPEPAARVSSEVAAGYDALRRGELERARGSYQSALARDPRGLDANLGMATVEARSGNRPAAANYYRRALEVDPQNPTALAGLAGVADFARVEGLETRLMEDIGRQPRSAALHFALGNLFASQSRWHDAQAAYYEAHRLEPANADVAYNLAVALDQLGQSRLAAEHYRRALEAARGQQPQFDPPQVERRLAELAAGTVR